MIQKPFTFIKSTFYIAQWSIRIVQQVSKVVSIDRLVIALKKKRKKYHNYIKRNFGSIWGSLLAYSILYAAYTMSSLRVCYMVQVQF